MLACDRRLWLERRAPPRREPRDDHGRVLRERSIALERGVHARFPDLAGPLLRDGVGIAEAIAETRRLFAPGGPALARPAFESRDGTRLATPALVWWEQGELVVCEIRLALRPEVRRDLALQMAHHAAVIAEATGHAVSRTRVVNGRGELRDVTPESLGRWEAAAARAAALLGDAPEPRTLQGHSFCQDCAFYEHCWDAAEAERRVEVLPGLPRAAAALLAERGITTFDALAAAGPGVFDGTPFERDAGRFAAQARAHANGTPAWRGDPGLPRNRTPIWMDLEGAAMGEASEHPIYLWGLAVEPAAPGESPRPESIFADLGPGGDRRGWDRFVARAEAILRDHPDALWVHWQDAEPMWVRRYVARFGAPAALAGHWASPGAFLDLYRVLDRSVRLPLRSYSVKWVAPFAGFEWRNPESGSEWSLVQFQRVLDSQDPAERERLLGEIAEYNADDLLALRAVWRWLEAHGGRARRA
jgi:uncharacterized protein